jgi:histidine triad (HIT) family protein
MYNHAPENYQCPICLGVNGVENEATLLKQSDLVYKDDLVVCLSTVLIDTAKGHVIVVPNSHYENIFDLPVEVVHRIADVAKKMSLAIKETYQCDGITLRQNNEPAGNQHAFHYHLHIYPRYDNDSYNENMTKKSLLSTPEERLEYANN